VDALEGRPYKRANRLEGAGLAARESWDGMRTRVKPGSRRRTTGAIERACRDKRLRMTGQRRLIARILDEATDHPDVVELHRRAVDADPKISLSTVYRTVKLLEGEGIIERLEFRDGRSRYEQAPREHHDHLINLRTGDVVEFRSEEIEALQTEIARRLGFRLVYHRLELYAVPLDEADAAGETGSAER
jgi:Fur family transcriptional regulator, ferric uptake regulator